jgi:hypothetical protein
VARRGGRQFRIVRGHGGRDAGAVLPVSAVARCRVERAEGTGQPAGEVEAQGLIATRDDYPISSSMTLALNLLVGWVCRF